jgi:hypothetical protein
MNITNTLFRAARLSADVRAISRGPAPAARRFLFKPVYRKVNGTLSGLLRKVWKP